MPKPVDKWGLLLCGPLLRRVEPGLVCVFVALKHSRRVRISIYPPGPATGMPVASGFDTTRRIGKFLHVVVVAAVPTGGSALVPGTVYRYNMTLEVAGGRDPGDTFAATENLASLNLLTGSLALGYLPGALPSFALPPKDVGDLKLAQASCRKPHGERLDALRALDEIIKQNLDDPFTRPHQLFFTGDQIYADDVAAPLLEELVEAGQTLLGWPTSETIPGLGPVTDFKPGDRASKLVPPFSSDAAGSHLMGLGEFLAMYLFVWSEELWPTVLPTFATLPSDKRNRYENNAIDAKKYDGQVASLTRFKRALGKVRRALANVPTYMIFDDHDVTDDWFLDRALYEQVTKSAIGTRIIVNALVSYAIFQGWGNTPEQFGPGTVGDGLLTAVKDWRGQDNSQFVTLSSAVQVPSTSGSGLRWDFEYLGPAHQVITLNTRTQRGYPSGDRLGHPDLLTESGLQAQVIDRQPGRSGRTLRPVTVLVSPAPVIGHPTHDQIAETLGGLGRSRWGDREAWLNPDRRGGWERLLAALVPFRRVCILSGDVHYSFGALLRYWDEHTVPGTSATFVQFVSSALKNEDRNTRELATIPFRRGSAYLGWDQPGDHLATRNGSMISVTGTADGTGPAVRRHSGDEIGLRPPQWRYEVSFLADERPASARGMADPPPLFPITTLGIWPEEFVFRAREHAAQVEQASMRIVVGRNSLGLVGFNSEGPSSAPVSVSCFQRSYVRAHPDADLLPHTVHAAVLDPPGAQDRGPLPGAVSTTVPDLRAWAEMISFRPPPEVQRELRARDATWQMHRVERSLSQINLDYYPVLVSKLPSIAGGPIVPGELIGIIRRLLLVKDQVVAADRSEFHLYDAGVDGTRWESSSPLGAVIHIDLKVQGVTADGGSVVVSDHRADRWVFSTLHTTKDGNHPVSGNREFRISNNADGTYTVFTRGADRATDVGGLASDVVFQQGDALWRTFQARVAAYVRAGGGDATVQAPVSERYNWLAVASRYWSPSRDWPR